MTLLPFPLACFLKEICVCEEGGWGGSAGTQTSLCFAAVGDSFSRCCLLPASIRKRMAISLRGPDKPEHLLAGFKGAAADFYFPSLINCHTNLFQDSPLNG